MKRPPAQRASGPVGGDLLMADDDKKIEESKVTEESNETKEDLPSVALAKDGKAEAAKGEPRSAEREPKTNPPAGGKVSKKLEGIISEIEKLSVLELSELVKALETKFGVSAAAPVAVAAAGASQGAAGDEGASEQTSFNVILVDGGANKISVIKAVREIVPTLGLKEAKDLVDAAPKPVIEGVNKETATEAKTKLEAAGAKVELK